MRFELRPPVQAVVTELGEGEFGDDPGPGGREQKVLGTPVVQQRQRRSQRGQLR
jgi:hypothetical protein